MDPFVYQILTAEQQYDNLIAKWLLMDQERSEIIFFLRHHSYFKVMLYFRPYRSVNDAGNRRFHDWSTWTRILQDYNFDHDLRITLFSYIIFIENSFKNTLCQLTCQKRWNTRWEDVAHFNDPQVFVESIQPILNEILLWRSKHEHVQKYIERHIDPKNPPFRNMIEVFTFGQVVKMYRYLADTQIRKEIWKQYQLDESKLWSWMKTLVDARNICCHHNKLFDKTNWKIARVRAIDQMLDQRCDTLYHVCTLMHYLLNQIRVNNTFIHDLDMLFTKYPDVQNSFPENWKELWS